MTEQPKAEPVGEVYRHGKDSHGRQWHGIHWYDPNIDVPTGTKLYTAPPRREWRSLSEEEIYPLYSEPSSDAEMVEFARAVEAKLKELNHHE
jgi:hypothetical protein